MARTTDGPVVAARRRFTDAVHALADPQPSWVDGTCHWTPAVYTRLRRVLRGQPVSSRQVPQSRLPCHAGVLALLVEIDDGVAGWLREGFGTTDKLGRLRDRTWRPQDCGLLEARAADLRRWTGGRRGAPARHSPGGGVAAALPVVWAAVRLPVVPWGERQIMGVAGVGRRSTLSGL